MSQLTREERLEALQRRLAENSLAGHWQPRQRPVPLKPHVWRWSTIYSCLLEAGEVIDLGGAGEANARRTVQLINPILKEQKATTRTLQMSVQLVKPGERAECHRHTAAALRFVIEGDGTGYTTVEGEQMPMEPGDLVLTPNWTWHDHYNPGKNPIVWLDVLDLHLTAHLGAMLQELYPDGVAQPIVKPEGYCRQRFGAVRPRGEGGSQAFPYTYKWRDALAALEKAASAGERDPFDGVLLEYSNPVTGGPTMPTIGCWVQWLAPGETTRAHRHMSNTIYHVVQGEGVTAVGEMKSGGQELAWGPKDCFFVPGWRWHWHQNSSPVEPAILFSVTDRPVLESLGLYREEGN